MRPDLRSWIHTNGFSDHRQKQSTMKIELKRDLQRQQLNVTHEGGRLVPLTNLIQYRQTDSDLGTNFSQNLKLLLIEFLIFNLPLVNTKFQLLCVFMMKMLSCVRETERKAISDGLVKRLTTQRSY